MIKGCSECTFTSVSAKTDPAGRHMDEQRSMNRVEIAASDAASTFDLTKAEITGLVYLVSASIRDPVID